MSGSSTHDAVQRASTKEEERTAEGILDVDELYELPRQARDVLFILLKEKSSLSIGDIRNIYMQYLKDLSIEFKLAIWKSCGFTYNRLFNLAEYKPLIDKLDKFDPLTDMLYSYISGFVDQKHNIKKWKHENDLKEFEQVLKLRPFSFGKIDLILTSLKNRPIPLIVKEEAENQKESAFYKPSSLLRKAWLSKKEELYKRVIKGDAELLVKARGVEYLAFYDIKIEIADYLPTDGIKALL